MTKEQCTQNQHVKQSTRAKVCLNESTLEYKTIEGFQTTFFFSILTLFMISIVFDDLLSQLTPLRHQNFIPLMWQKFSILNNHIQRKSKWLQAFSCLKSTNFQTFFILFPKTLNLKFNTNLFKYERGIEFDFILNALACYLQWVNGSGGYWRWDHVKGGGKGKSTKIENLKWEVNPKPLLIWSLVIIYLYTWSKTWPIFGAMPHTCSTLI